MNILAFESTCDETAVAVVRDGREILSNQVFSQADLHAVYGGVVPEIASRSHVEAISLLSERALQEACVPGCGRCAGKGGDPGGNAAASQGPGHLAV